MKLIHLLFVIFYIPAIAYSQKPYTLKIIEIGNKGVLKQISYSTQLSTIQESEKEMKNVLYAIWELSFITARYDSICLDSNSNTAYLNTGEKHKWASLKNGNVEESILNSIGYRSKLWNNRKLKYSEAENLQEKILKWCENNGYPFASIHLDSISFIDEQTVSAKLFIEKKRRTKIDSIEIKGNLNLSKSFLLNYIGILSGDAYDESKLQATSKRIEELSFTKETKPYTILFTEKYTKLTLFLDKKRASQLDGIVGFQPDSRTGKIVFTGDARLRLQNSFAHGEIIEFNWRRLQEATQDLKAHFNYPFVFNTPVGIDYDIKLYRRDTSFIDINQTLSFQYLFSANTWLNAFVKRRSSNLLSTYGLESITVLPQIADISKTSYGLGFYREQLDYRFNPRKGYSINISSDIGNRIIQKNSKLNPIIYETVQLKSTQVSGTFIISKFWPVGKRSTIKSEIQSAGLFNTGIIFKNELLRIGGLKNLRGFDEESIFASFYTTGTIEYRFQLEQNSWFFLFADGAWYENNSNGKYTNDTPYSFGTGLTFESKAGIFALTYALGSQQGNSIQFKDGKIHVGYIGLF